MDHFPSVAWISFSAARTGVGSDFTWNVELAAIWNATENFSLALGYRHMALEESIDTRFEDIDLALSGPEFGFVFRF